MSAVCLLARCTRAFREPCLSVYCVQPGQPSQPPLPSPSTYGNSNPLIPGASLETSESPLTSHDSVGPQPHYGLHM